MRVPRKLKKEKDKVEVRFYTQTGKREVIILPNVKINKWTLKVVFELKRELERRDKLIWKEVCDEFLNPNKINKKVSFNLYEQPK